jgi:HSP20 family protein
LVTAELPGLTKDDVKVELTQDGLLIQGERKEEHEERQKDLLRSERRYGRFSRLIPLPEEANVEQAKAQFNNGVLELTIPIPEEKRKRREIPIESGGGQAADAA